MVTLRRNVDLYNAMPNGYESSVAKSQQSVFVTTNVGNRDSGAAYSGDWGASFKKVSSYDLMTKLGLDFCCDQVVQFVAKINTFVWILQSNPDSNGENAYGMAVSTPERLNASAGKDWSVAVLTSKSFNQPGQSFDYPQLSVGDNFLYLTFNVPGVSKAIIARFPLALLGKASGGGAGSGPPGSSSYAVVATTWLCPAQNTGATGFFGASTDNINIVRVYRWDEGTGKLTHSDVSVLSLAMDNFATTLPTAKIDWFRPVTRFFPRMFGGTRTGNEVWFAWSGGRRVYGQTEDTFPYPHIGIVVVDATTMKAIRQWAIWNPDFAFAYPALATNAAGEVGISCMAGGGKRDPQHVVGFLTAPFELQTTTWTPSIGGGGHYVGICRAEPEGTCFAAAAHVAQIDPKGYKNPLDGPFAYWNRPRYVLFGRQGSKCETVQHDLPLPKPPPKSPN